MFAALRPRPNIRTPSARRLVFFIAALLLSWLFPVVSVHAGTIGISDGKLIVGTESTDGNQSITASISGSNLVIEGIDFDIVTPGCTRQDAIICALLGVTELVVLGGNGDDVINLSNISVPPFVTLLVGGPGNDVVIGSGGDDNIFGGPGDDVLNGLGGRNCISGGGGNDILFSGNGSCVGAPDPNVVPLPRPATGVPEPRPVVLTFCGCALLLWLRRNAFRRWRPLV